MKRKDRFLNEFDGKGKVLSAFLGVLTLFAVLGQIAPGMYEQMPAYTEWICGVTTWSAYNKQADMSIVQMALIGLPVLFLLFGIIYVWWNRITEHRCEEAGIAFVITYIAILFMFFMQKESGPQWLIIWVCLFAGYMCLAREQQTDVFAGLVGKSMIVVLAGTSVVLALSFFSASVGALWQRISGAVMVAGGVAFLVFVCVPASRKNAFCPVWLQLLLPFAWLGFVHFRYRYEKDGALVELFYSGRWKWVCLLMCLFFLAIAVAEIKKTKHEILFSTFVMTAVIRVFSQPEGMLNIDYFHNGEIMMPMQQLVSFGKLPYRDIIPIHGLCDYYYGLINYLFFDGTYISLNAAKVVGDLLMAVVLTIAIWYFGQHKFQSFVVVWLFIPFMISGAGMRYWFMFLLFFVLFSGRMEKGMQSLFAWILLSIAAIAWNASIGGAAALAFLPIIVFRSFRDIPSQWKELCYSREKGKRNAIFVAWGILFVIGIAFIPLFLKIVAYLRENTGTTLYVNGMEMLSEVSEAAEYFVPGLLNSQGSFWIVTFAFLIPLLIAFAMWLRKRKTGAGEMFITYLLAFWVLANYAFVRYDDGLRSGVLGVFFLFLTAITLLWKSRREEVPRKTYMLSGLYVAVLALALLMTDDAPFVTADTLTLEKEVPEYVDTVIMGRSIEDPVLHVSGELVSMPNLGTGFIQGNTLAGLKNVHTLTEAAEQNGQTIFDVTNAVANAVILDMPLYLPYSSAYNISNAVMQENAISLLENNLPDIILAAPEIRFDDAPLSYRCMTLYRYLMEQDYVPYKYENVIYLVRGKNPLPQAQQDWEAFAQLMHKKDLAYLPAVWGSNAEEIKEPLTEIETNMRIVEAENGVRIVFDTPVSGRELTMIGISGLSAGEDSEKEVSMTMASKISSEQAVSFTFALKGDEYLVPVCCSPYVMQEEVITHVELTSGEWEEGLADEIKIRLYR